MPSATDNVYVNIIANTQGFTEKIKAALQPLRQFVQVVQSVMALGGAAMVIRRIAAEIGEMEKAYAKLYPESQKAAGSLKDWNDTMARMKADGGGIVASVLTPIRQALLDIIDPAHEAKLAIQGITDKISGWEKYTSAETKSLNEMKEAVQALSDATNERSSLSVQIAEYERMVTSLGNRPDFGQRTLAYMGSGYDTSAAQAKATQDISNYDRSLKFLTDTLKKLRVDLDKAKNAIIEIPKWMDEHKKKNGELEKSLLLLGDAAAQTAIDLSGLAKAEADIAQVMSEANGNNPQEPATPNGGKMGSEGRIARSMVYIGKNTRYAREEAEKLVEVWSGYADIVQSISEALGEAFVTGDYVGALIKITQAMLNLIAKEAIAAGLRIIVEKGTAGLPVGLALIAMGGLSLGISAGIGSTGSTGPLNDVGVSMPHMAAGGVVTRPTLAMIGEAGPEAVVPLGRGGYGSPTIIVQGSIWQTEDLARAVAGAMSRW